jgi:hypothetical protein
MKRYLMFTFDTYYPSGGEGDFCGDFDSIQEAISAWKNQQFRREFCEILDTETGEWQEAYNEMDKN